MAISWYFIMWIYVLSFIKLNFTQVFIYISSWWTRIDWLLIYLQYLEHWLLFFIFQTLIGSCHFGLQVQLFFCICWYQILFSYCDWCLTKASVVCNQERKNAVDFIFLAVWGIFLVMNSLSNSFSVLHLDAGDDTEQVASLTVAKDKNHATKSGWFSSMKIPVLQVHL